MNIIEVVKSALQSFPQINEVCNEISIDFTDDTIDSYGLSSTGDTLLKEDILGNQTRQHNFILYAVYQSVNDYDRMVNTGALLSLQMYLEHFADNQEVTVKVGDKEYIGTLTKLTCSNGMIYEIPNGDMNNGVVYQLQIISQYKIDF
jgi:hypothetical protein